MTKCPKIIVALFAFFATVSGILRNPITGRCIHIGRNEDEGLSASAKPCTFTNIQTGEEGSSDQWVEVVPVSRDPKEQGHTIQKHGENTISCILFQSDSITVGPCSSPEAVLLFNKVKHNLKSRPSYESSFTGPLFTIEQPGTNKCLTVFPGNSELHLSNCSEKVPLQRWVRCRHIEACDVDIKWSPSKIMFPNDPFNATSDFQEINPQTSSSSNKIAESTETFGLKVIINEPLYFVFNALKFMDLQDAKLSHHIDKFYSNKELQTAQNILETNFAQSDIDPRSQSLQKSIQIIKLMKQITANNLNARVVFASANLARVPPIYAIKTVTIEKTSPEEVEKVNHLKDRVETHLNSVIKELKSFMGKVLSEIDHFGTRPVSASSSKMQSEKNSEAESDTDVDMIDLRLKQP